MGLRQILARAATALRLETARIIDLVGDVTGSVSFDGSQDVSITTTNNDKGSTAVALHVAQPDPHIQYAKLAGDTFTGNLVVDVTTTTEAVRITQRGTGDVLRIEDSNNPDATPFRITADGSIVSANPASLGVTSSPNLRTDDLQFTGTNSPVHTHAGGINGTLANNTLYQVGTFTPQLDGQHSTIEGAIHLGSNAGVRTFRFQAQCRRNTSATTPVNAFLFVDTDELDGIRDFGQFEFYLETTLPSTKFVVAFRTGALGTNVLSTHWNVLIHDRSTKSLWEQVSTNTIFDPTGYTLLAPNMDNRISSQKLTAPEFIGPLTGNASTASTLQTPRTITLAGDVTGSTTFDGSANVTITAISNASSGAPTLVEANKSYKVAKNLQVLFTEEIDLEDGAEIDFDENAVLVEVN